MAPGVIARAATAFARHGLRRPPPSLISGVRPPSNTPSPMPEEHTAEFESLLAFIERLPAILLPAGRRSIGTGRFENGNWWMKFHLDTDHPLAWRHVQELGFVRNYVSVTERLPTVFMPVSPPPYMNGGVEFLSWIIESTDPAFSPSLCAEWLEGRLPTPVDDVAQWDTESDDGDETPPSTR
jgi:hypothetical protein